MDLQNFIAAFIAPRATSKVIEENSGGVISLGEGNPYFENQRSAKSKMIEAFRKVGDEVEKECLGELTNAFYEHKTLVYLYGGFGQEQMKDVNDKIQKAQQSVQLAFKKHELAQQASSYFHNILT